MTNLAGEGIPVTAAPLDNFMGVKPMKLELARELAFYTLLGLSMITDLFTRKIYNYLTFPAIGLGMAIGIWQGGWNGLSQSLGGILTGVSFLLPFFLAGGVGGGDLKLLAAVGALGGFPFILEALLYSSICGGLMALWALARRGEFVDGIKNCATLVIRLFFPFWPLTGIGRQPTGVLIPYGAAIALGSSLAYILMK